ncbi:MAG: beta strand repeat-containing protein [Planctomycetales bacterium]
MLWRSFWKNWCRTAPGLAGRDVRRGDARRPLRAAEVLEDRCLLSTITVTSLADNLTVDGQVTLREALKAANTNASVDGSAAGQTPIQDVIVFQPGLTGTIQLNPALGQLKISDTVKIVGLGAGSTVIDGQQGLALFFIGGDNDADSGGNVSFEKLTLTGGKTSAVPSGFQSGGAIRSTSSGVLSVIDSVISGNSASDTGGAIYSRNGAVKITGSTISGNSTTGVNAAGGAIWLGSGALTISDSQVTGNSTVGKYAGGGGLYTFNGSITVTRSTISGNSAAKSAGGGIDSQNGNITISDSTISGNSAFQGGGGLHASSATTIVVNSTFTENSTGGAGGGGIGSFNSGHLKLMHTTVSGNTLTGNTASNTYGGGLMSLYGTTSIVNSIIAGNTDSDALRSDLRLVNSPLTMKNSLIGSNRSTLLVAAPVGAPDANGNMIGSVASPINPLLGALADNGGPTKTMALLTGSPALNAGSNALSVHPATAAALVTDQRGGTFSRKSDGTVDMGAWEAPGLVTLTVAPSAIEEDGGQATVTATLTGISNLDTTVELAFSGTAIRDTDYTASSATIVIPAGQLSKSVTLTGKADALPETDETIIVDITQVTNGLESGVQQVTARISETVVTLQVSAPSMQEAAGQVTLTAVRSVALPVATTVNLQYSGQAVRGTDYNAATQIVIPAGQLNASIQISAISDTLDELASESIVVDISDVTNGAEDGTQQVQTSITDDDPAPTVTLGINPATIAEAAGQTTLTATLNAISGQDVTVDLDYSGTATRDVDYTSASQIVIPAGQLSATTKLTAIQDSVFEANETAIVDITGVTNGTESGVQQVTATIFNDESTPSVTLAVSPLTLGENGGQTVLTATLSAVSGLDTTVALAFSGTATKDTDYTAPSSQIIIPAGQLSATLTLTANSDGAAEADETIIVDIASVTNATESGVQQVTATLTENVVTLSVNPASIAENGGIATVTATQSQVRAQPTTVTLAFSGTATNVTDYTRSATQIVIAAGQLSGTISLTAVQDALFEGNETIIVDIAEVASGAESGVQQVTATITDDDPAPTVTLSRNPATLLEAAGQSTVTATLSAVSGLPTTINLAFSGTATQNTDYAASGAQIVIPAGQTTGTVTLTATQDSLDEQGETIVVDITSVVNGTESGVQQVTATITDDDAPISRVLPLAAATATNSFTVTWAGSAGVSKYNVFVSDNGAPFTSFQANTTATSATFNGQAGRTYEFYCVATDVDNQTQANPNGAQAVTYTGTAAAFQRLAGLEGQYWIGDQKGSVLRNGNQLTLIRPNGQSFVATLANNGTELLVPNTSTVLATFDAAAGTISFIDGSAMWQVIRQLGGRYFTGTGKVAGVKQLGTDFTFTGGTGALSSGSFINHLQVVATAWGVTGTLSRNGTEIRWSNNTFWSLIPDVDGAWSNAAGNPLRIEQAGANLVLVNKVGQTATAVFITPNQIIATGWGNLVGTLEGQVIKWSNNTSWTYTPVTGPNPDLGGVWDVGGQDTRILQNANGLTFVNRSGGTSTGSFTSPTQVVATDWGPAQGTIGGNGTTLTWASNNIVWTKLPKVTGPAITAAGKETGIIQLERNLTLVDELGQTTQGRLTSPTTFVETTGALRSGTIAGKVFTWNNGGPVWALVSDLRGNWTRTSNSTPTYVVQSGIQLLMINETGAISVGQFSSPTQAQVVPVGVANPPTINVGVLPAQLTFSDGPVWQKTNPSALDAIFADPSMWPFL